MKFLILPLVLYSILLCNSCAKIPGSQADKNTDDLSNMLSDSMLENLKSEKDTLAQKMNAAQITYFVIKVPEDRFGYSIFIDGQMYIEQKTIPAIQGNIGFATKEDAEKIAKLVIQKIRDGELPPTISPAELTKNGIGIWQMEW